MRSRAVTGRGARGTGKARAITFLEIMVVIVILGILISVTAARMKGTGQRAALTGSAREIVAACNLARQSAISTQRDVRVKFDVDNDRWRLDFNIDIEELGDEYRYTDDEARFTEERIRELPPKVFFVEVQTDTNAFAEADDGDKYPLIIFHPDGTATGSYVVLENERGRKMTVQVARATGRVEAFRGGPMSFEDKLEALGVDPRAFASADPAASNPALPGAETLDPNDPNADRQARERRDRDQYIRDALERIASARGWNLETMYGR